LSAVARWANPPAAPPAYHCRQYRIHALTEETQMTRSTRTLALALLAPALVVAACKKDSDADAGAADTTAVAPAATDTAAAATPAAAPAGTVSDAQIAAIVLAANTVDSTGGEMAQQKATNADVKKFGQTMVTDHGGVNKQAVALAGRLSLTPEENPTSTQLKQGGQQSAAQLNGLSGAAFDRAYIDHEVEYHQTVLDALDQTLIPNAQNAELKALLQQVRPAVAAHLDMAKGLQTKLQGS
jgi:putative membrane protein